MKPAERLYTAINREKPDRAPVAPKIWVDLAANLTGTDLLEIVTNPLIALNVIVEAGYLCKVDAVRQFHLPARRIRQAQGKVFDIDRNNEIRGEIDMQGGLITHLYDANSFKLDDPYTMAHYHFWTAEKPFVRDLEDVRRIVVPEKTFYEKIGCGERQRQIMGRVGDTLGLIGDCSSATMAFCVSMRGMQAALLDLIEQPKLVHALMEKGAAIAIEKGKFNIDLGLKVLRLNDSVGNMSVISPRHWRKFIFPHIKTVCEELHTYDHDVRIYCHICGNILPIAEDLVQTGLDCLGPLDPLGGFTPADMRQRVGDSVSLMGGVNTLTFLDGTPENVLGESKICIQQAGQNGGYILGSGCVVPRNARKEQLQALRTAAELYGIYTS